MSYRRQLRRDLAAHRRDQGLELLNRKLAAAWQEKAAAILPVADEASTPVDPPSPGVS